MTCLPPIPRIILSCVLKEDDLHLMLHRLLLYWRYSIIITILAKCDESPYSKKLIWNGFNRTSRCLPSGYSPETRVAQSQPEKFGRESNWNHERWKVAFTSTEGYSSFTTNALAHTVTSIPQNLSLFATIFSKKAFPCGWSFLYNIMIIQLLIIADDDQKGSTSGVSRISIIQSWNFETPRLLHLCSPEVIAVILNWKGNSFTRLLLPAGTTGTGTIVLVLVGKRVEGGVPSGSRLPIEIISHITVPSLVGTEMPSVGYTARTCSEHKNDGDACVKAARKAMTGNIKTQNIINSHLKVETPLNYPPDHPRAGHCVTVCSPSCIFSLWEPITRSILHSWCVTLRYAFPFF